MVNRIDNLQSPKERISYVKIASDTLRVSSMAYRMMSFSVFCFERSFLFRASILDDSACITVLILSSINGNPRESLFTDTCATYIQERYLNSSTWIVDDFVFFPFFSFFPRLRHMSRSNSKISANDSTDIPIQRPSDPPRSETKFASCEIIEELKKDQK